MSVLVLPENLGKAIIEPQDGVEATIRISYGLLRAGIRPILLVMADGSFLELVNFSVMTNTCKLKLFCLKILS